MGEQSRYFGTTLTNQNSSQEKIKSRLQSENACRHSVQNLLCSSLLSKNIKIKKICRTVMLRVVWMGMKLGVSHLGRNVAWRYWGNRVQRKIFEPKRDEVTGDWRRLHYEKLNDLYSSNITRVIKSFIGGGGGAGEVPTGFWWKDLMEKNTTWKT